MSITKKNKVIVAGFLLLSLLGLFLYTALINVPKGGCNCSLDPSQSNFVFSGVYKNEERVLVKPSNIFLENQAGNKWYIFTWYPSSSLEENERLKVGSTIGLMDGGIHFGDFFVENGRVKTYGHQMLSTTQKYNVVKLCQHYAPLYFEDRKLEVKEYCSGYCKNEKDSFCIKIANQKEIEKMIKGNTSPNNINN